jgi:hypothetical protein
MTGASFLRHVTWSETTLRWGTRDRQSVGQSEYHGYEICNFLVYLICKKCKEILFVPYILLHFIVMFFFEDRLCFDMLRGRVGWRIF